MKTKEEYLEEIYSYFPNEEDKDEAMCDRIVDAIETGIDYWCEDYPNADGESEYYSERVWECVKNDETLVFVGNNERGELNLKSICEGLKKLSKQYPSLYADFIDNPDAISCDAFFQMCVFGEIVFG